MDVRLPNLGEGAESGTVVSILVKEGDQISKGQTILELENEKAVAPIPSTVTGTVSKIRVKEGDKLAVGQLILSTTDAEAPSVQTKTAPAAPRKAPLAQPEAEVAEDEQEKAERTESRPAPAASPSIRKIARELGIDLRRIRGSESGGRIVMADLRAYIERLEKLVARPAGAAGRSAAAAAPSIDFAKWGEITKKPLSPIRKTIIERMSESWTTIPHVTQFDEADITSLMELRKKYAPQYEKKSARLTLTSFALKIVVDALKKYPIFNGSFDEAADEIVFKEYYHIGLAVDTDQGLIVPVLRDVDKKSIFVLSKEIAELAEKARDRKISLEDLKGSSFTISNQGGIGGRHFTPIINKPNVAILGLGRGSVKPVVRNNKIEPRTILPIALSYDHRLIDGAAAARFTVELVHGFENFSEEFLKS